MAASRTSGDVKRDKLLLYGTSCFCCASWHKRIFNLSDDGTLCWYRHSYSLYADGYINIVTGKQRILVGSITRTLADCPPVPRGGTYDYVIAISTLPDPDSPHMWLYCQTQEKFMSWVDTIMCVLDPSPTMSSYS